MKLHFLSLGIASIAAFALFLAAPVFASSTYPFTLRGVVDIQAPTKSVVYVTVTNGSAKALAEVQGQNIGYSIGTAKIYKITNMGKKLVSWKQIKMDDEVVMKGNRVGTTFKVSELVINDRSFDLVGKVTDINTDVKTINVNVIHSTYREKGIKSTEITLKYTGDTACKRLGSDVACSTVDALHQVVRAKGSVTGENQVYTLTNFWDNYK
ncbi:MAG TPA: hypothetical protein VLG69_03035 [Candidatus Andersenbacteria bacterium]|nr:hypothetical protein [Candidatus Andersenbacteria bacterium]